MSYLEQYDRIPEERLEEKAKLVNHWIRTTDWRPFFKELRENNPIFPTPGNIILVTLFDVVQEKKARIAREMDKKTGKSSSNQSVIKTCAECRQFNQT